MKKQRGPRKKSIYIYMILTMILMPISVRQFVNHNLQHDEWDNSTHELRKWMWKRNPHLSTYHLIPAGFGMYPHFSSPILSYLTLYIKPNLLSCRTSPHHQLPSQINLTTSKHLHPHSKYKPNHHQNHRNPNLYYLPHPSPKFLPY